MGGEKQSGTSTQVINQTSTPTPTAEETALNQQYLKEYQASAPGRMQAQQSGYGLINQLLMGGGLPGYLSSLSGGISPQTIAEQSTNYAMKAMPGMQSLGILDSGEALRSISKGIATDINLPSQQFNQNQLLQMLNLASGQAAQTQQLNYGQGNTLSQALAGLRSTSTQGTTTGTTSQTTGKSFFDSQFMGGIGQGIGAGASAAFFGTPCWVAAEIYGGWYEPKTCAARYYISNLSPYWFKNLYYRYGERIARFIHNKPIFKMLLKPLFDYFVFRGSRETVGGLNG
jgi:hypothetical protein